MDKAEISKYMSEIGKKGAEGFKNLTPEQRSAAAKKGWKTKRLLRKEAELFRDNEQYERTENEP